MQICECGEGPPHHPSEHYAKQRDAWIAKVKVFMDRVYPPEIFVSINEHRKIIECITACFVLDEIEAKFYLSKKD